MSSYFTEIQVLVKDLLSRETNIVLIDEFDKVNIGLYSVFYQMFDEGELEDINYSVDVSNVYLF